MDKLKSLEIKKLLKELDYIESDFEYRTEVINEADSEFMQSVNNFLSLHPELKEIYDQKITNRINETIEKNINKSTNIDDITDININIDEVNDIGIVKEDTSPKLKKLYREIVKLTHPDKVKRKKLNDIYIEATDYYNLNDKIGIYKICNDLDIDYNIEDDDELFIYNKIESFKNRIVFLESTFTWKWYRTKSEEEKNQILVNYIKLRIQ